MARLRFGTLLLPLALTGAAAPVLAANKTFLIGSFEELIVEGDIRVVLDNSRAASAKASGDRSLVEAVKIERNGLQLRIRIQDYEGDTINAKPNQPLTIALGGRGVTRLLANGSASISVNQIRANGGSASLRVSGPGSIKVDRLETDRITIGVAGSGSIDIGSGRARSGQFSVDGTGTVAASNFALQQAKILQTGNAKTHIAVFEQVEITNAGSGEIVVDGKATCFVRRPGSARIVCGKLAQQ